MKKHYLKIIISILILIIITIISALFCFTRYQQKQPSKYSLTKERPFVSTAGWKQYTNDEFSIKYPPNYKINDQQYVNSYPDLEKIGGKVITITETPDGQILSGDSYAPGAWSGVEIFAPQEFTCSKPSTCELNDKAISNRLEFFPTDWKELMYQIDGHSPIKAGTSKTTIGDKMAIHQWFVDRSGIEGYPLSESNLYIKTNGSHLLLIKGEARRDFEKNLAIIETMYSTIIFYK